MQDKPSIYLGIDPSRRYQPFVYAALDMERQIIAIGSGPLTEVLAYCAGLANACLAINSPRYPNQGLVDAEEEKQTLFPVPASKRGDLRKVELRLLEEGIRVTRTPASEKECPVWMQRGFKLYERLQRLGYMPYPHLDSHIYLEVPAEAAFSRLAGGAPLFEDDTLEGRLQRQLVLYENQLPVGDAMKFFEEVTRYRLMRGVLPMDGIYTSGELNALVCAFTAWLLFQEDGAVVCLGDEREGEIYLPPLAADVFHPRRVYKGG
jgi:hypothetical protein